MRVGRLILVSNRLPVTIEANGADLQVIPSAGGVATGLAGVHRPDAGTWVGWPGFADRGDEAERERCAERLAPLGYSPVHLSATEVAHYYSGYANRVLWPLFHYLPERVPYHSTDWDAYEAVNARFADAVAAAYRPGDIIWVHDYQLLLVPAMLRERLPEATIGFFLHIPFPSFEVLRMLPTRNEILRGLLGADLVGFHASSYVAHFRDALEQVLGLPAAARRVALPRRQVLLDSSPMGIDVDRFGRLAASDAVVRRAEQLKADGGGRAILLGIDRLDYTKGLPRRLLAFERLLETDSALRDRVRMIQVAIPSREDIDTYQATRREVEELVGRINGRFGSVSASPVHYVHGRVTAEELAALYRAADVMLVTPLRDGMNLVAKEFVATRNDEDGVLVLSEFAGAAAELKAAVLVNPYDIEATAAWLGAALRLAPAERRARMRRLREVVLGGGVAQWAARFLATLDEAAAQRRRARLRVLAQATLAEAGSRVASIAASGLF